MAISSPLKYHDIPENSSIRRIRYLTLQGGGMKGLGFVSAIEELENTGVLDQLEEVAGSSAGAIVATLLALGYTATEIRREMLALNFRSLQDKDYPGWIESTGLKDILQGGSEMLLSEESRLAVLKKIPKIKQAFSLPSQTFDAIERIEDILGIAFGKELGLWKGEALINLMSRLIVRKTGNPNLTFAELATLAKAKPGKFRALHLTGTNLTTSRLELYNAKDWPDMCILDAVRISSSYPGGFKPFTKPLTEKEKADQEEGIMTVRLDGGTLQNLPNLFNQPPYHNPTIDEPGNKEAFAISFLPDKKKEPRQFKNGIDLAKALFTTIMSEEELRELYEDRIAYIDPVGVGTLDFDAPLDKRLKLANSGGPAIRAAFHNILQKEVNEVSDYEKMSLEELVRHRVALQTKLRQREEVLRLSQGANPIMRDLRQIDQQLKKRDISHDNLKNLEDKYRKKINQRLKGISKVLPTDQELIEICQDKQQELRRVHQELMRKYQQLKLVKQGFEWRLVELNARYVEKGFKNQFVKQLQELSYYQDLLRKNRDDKIKLELEKDSPDTEMTEAFFEKRKKELESEYRWLLHAKDLYFKGILSKYHDDRDELMSHFFEELQEECQDINCEIPSNREKVKEFYEKLLDECNSYINESKREIDRYKQEKEIIEGHIQAFSKRTSLSERYDVLKELKTELEISINNKTSLIGKINHYLVGDKPGLKKNIVTGCMQAVAFVSFLVRVGLVIPTIVYGVAQLVKRFSPSDSKRRATADRVINAFSMPNLFKLNKLREFSNMSAHLIKVLDENYAKADISEHSHLYKLLAYHLKITGLNVKDIFPKKEEETDEIYLNRIKTLEKNLELMAPDMIVLKDERAVPNQNMVQLRRKVLTEVLKIEEPDKKRIRESSEAKKIRLTNVTLKKNIQQIHKEFLQQSDKKRKEGLSLSKTEIAEYVDSAKALNKEIPEKIKEEYLSNANFKHDLGKTLSRKEVETIVEFSNDLKKMIPDGIKIRYSQWLKPRILKKGFGALQERQEFKDSREFKDDREFKDAMDLFVQKRRNKRSPNLEHQNKSSEDLNEPSPNKPKRRHRPKFPDEI